MPKALFFNIPAHGHINPSLPLVTELVQRGHHIRYFATSHYQKRILEAGAEYVAYKQIADHFFEQRGLNGTIPQQAAQALLETTKQMLPDLIEIAHQEQPDYILYDCMCPWGYFLAEIMKLPSVSSSSLPPLVPRAMLNWKIFCLLFPALVRGFRAGNNANRLSKSLAEQYNVQPLGMMNVLNAPGDVIISYSSSDYLLMANHLPENVKLVGWTLQENPTDEGFVHHSNRPLIYISLGTVSNNNMDFFRYCIDALGHGDYDVLMSTGGGISPETFGTLPDNITIQAWVPQVQVLKQASLFVTHGGLNSIHDGFYCGLPMLVVPQQVEQTLNAYRVVDLGAGLMLTAKDLNPSRIRESVKQLITNQQFTQHAQRIGESLKSAGGMKKAGDEIELLLGE